MNQLQNKHGLLNFHRQTKEPVGPCSNLFESVSNKPKSTENSSDNLQVPRQAETQMWSWKVVIAIGDWSSGPSSKHLRQDRAVPAVALGHFRPWRGRARWARRWWWCWYQCRGREDHQHWKRSQSNPAVKVTGKCYVNAPHNLRPDSIEELTWINLRKNLPRQLAIQLTWFSINTKP